MKEPTSALVTGGGRGIGKETAILLAKKEMNVVICRRTFMYTFFMQNSERQISTVLGFYVSLCQVKFL